MLGDTRRGGILVEPTVEIQFGGYTDTTSNMPSVLVDVTNAGGDPIPDIKLEWVYEYESPQDATADFIREHGAQFAETTGQPPVRASELGRRYSFNPAAGQSKGPLGVGETRTYLYPPEWLPDMLSVVQSLSPERYFVAITMNGKEEVAIPGKDFGEFVQRRFGSEGTPTNDLTEDRMQFIGNLVGRIVELNEAFKVCPPSEVTADPTILRSDEAVTKLAGTKWWLRFADGREELLTFTELMVLTYHLVMVKVQLMEAQRQGAMTGQVKVSFGMAVPAIMTPEGVKTLLSKLTLEGIEDRPS